MKPIHKLVVCTGVLAATSMACAQTQPPSPAPMTSPGTASKTTSNLASAEVLNVYPKEKRVLLKHGPIANLGMSEMTMEFGVAHSRMLKSLKPGKKIMFSAVMVKDDYIITHVEAAR